MNFNKQEAKRVVKCQRKYVLRALEAVRNSPKKATILEIAKSRAIRDCEHQQQRLKEIINEIKKL